MGTFQEKLKEMLSKLKAVEKQTRQHSTRSQTSETSSSEHHRRGNRQARRLTCPYRGRESIFKRPEAPLADCLPPRIVPDYLKNPEKWTCYNLQNVPDVSESSNAAAAAICRRDLMLDSDKKDDLGSDETNSKVVFKQPIIPKEEDKSKSTVKYKNSIVIYPEHVVGERSKPKKVKKDNVASDYPKRPTLKLDHLQHDDEE